MTLGWMRPVLMSAALMLGCAAANQAAAAEHAKSKIIHDFEYYILEAQHGEKWAAEACAFRRWPGGPA